MVINCPNLQYKRIFDFIVLFHVEKAFDLRARESLLESADVWRMELEQLTSFLSIAHAKCYKVVGEISGAIFSVFLGVLDSLFGVFGVHCESSARCNTLSNPLNS